VSITVNLNSDNGEFKPFAVTNPTGLNTSPRWNEYPCLEILNFDTSKYVDPIPVVELAPTSTFSKSPIPVFVVAPIPNLDTPTTFKFSYEGSDTNICGFVYPVPPAPTVKESVPPAPTDAVMIAVSPI
jgi:hypothetical protein